ncbi:MAG: type II toxin-antitoxin system RelE/ParE family toxin [Desulfuromusa sp.]
MDLKWSKKALTDIGRLYEFLETVDKRVAVQTIQMLTAAPTKLLTNPRIGEKIEEFLPRELRRLLIGHFELRYKIKSNTIYVLRLWHTRENR